MPKVSVAEFFIKALAELRDEERAATNSLLRLNIEAYVNRLVRDFRIQFRDGAPGTGLVSDRCLVRPNRARQIRSR
jgi:hypothetical protein